MKAVPRKKRADLRKALGNSALTYDPDADILTFYHCYSESQRNLGTPVRSFDFYRRITEAFNGDCVLSAVRHEGRPVAALMGFYCHDTFHAYYGGALSAARPLHGYDLLYWHSMRAAAEKGCGFFDFGRSKYDTGAFAYKMHWGFVPAPMTHLCWSLNGRPVPDLRPVNPEWSLPVAVWKHLPLCVAEWAGPFVSRHFG
jgi:FemAB-related protein (PEP-CTERM system-associated)